jgi:hypothetical protein
MPPSLRVAGFEDEDEDDNEDENEAAREGLGENHRRRAEIFAPPAPGRFTAFWATLLAISRGWVPGIERGPSSVR